MGAAMNRISRWLTGVLSRLLEPEEREAVQGDLAEAGESGARALAAVTGLAIRRLAAPWAGWRAWSGLFQTLLISLLLLNFSMFLEGMFHLYSWIAWNYADMDASALAETGLTLDHGVSLLISYSALLALWSYTIGRAAPVMARRALWICAAAIGLSWLTVSIRTSTPRLSIFLLLLPILGGSRHRARWGAPTLRQALLLGAALAGLTVVAVLHEGVLQRQAVVSLVLSLYLLAGSVLSRSERCS
jgi:hypothetical protein